MGMGWPELAAASGRSRRPVLAARTPESQQRHLATGHGLPWATATGPALSPAELNGAGRSEAACEARAGQPQPSPSQLRKNISQTGRGGKSP